MLKGATSSPYISLPPLSYNLPKDNYMPPFPFKVFIVDHCVERGPMSEEGLKISETWETSANSGSWNESSDSLSSWLWPEDTTWGNHSSSL